MHKRLQFLVAAEGLAMRLLKVELQLLTWKLNYLNQWFTILVIFKKKSFWISHFEKLSCYSIWQQSKYVHCFLSKEWQSVRLCSLMLCIFTLSLSVLKLHASHFCLTSLFTILMYFFMQKHAFHYSNTASFTVTVFKNNFLLFLTFSVTTVLYLFMSQFI